MKTRAIQTVFPWDVVQLTASRVMTMCRWVGHKATSSAELDPDGKPRFEQRLGKVGYEAWLRFYTPLCSGGVRVSETATGAEIFEPMMSVGSVN